MGYVWQRWLADALRKEGCTVKEVEGWQNRGRPASSGGFEPKGSTWHHTGSTTSNSNPHPTLAMCIAGRSDLPGPLCQVLIDYTGVCWVIAAGRANHAGTSNGFGSYYAGDGNAQSFGWEIDYNGTQAMSDAQKAAAAKASAAVAKKMGTDSSWVVTHKETSVTGKWDTGGVPGTMARILTRQQLDKDDDMPLSDEDVQKVAAAVWKYVLKNYDDQDNATENRAEVMLGQTHARAGDAKRNTQG